MLELTDFKVGQTAYILYLHTGRATAPSIHETIVKRVGRKFVTVSLYDKCFKRHGNIEALLEHTDIGERGYLYTTRAAAEKEAQRSNLLHNIRTYSPYFEKCTFEELRSIMDTLKKAERREI